jgi:hypothetical protein
VVPSWAALCWIPQEGFVQGYVSPPATDRYIGSARIISEAPLVCPNGCWYLLKKDGGLIFHNLNGCIRTINLNK